MIEEDYGDAEWREKATRALIFKQRVSKYLKKRIAFLKDPTGELRAKNREVYSLYSSTKEELYALLAFLEENHLEVLESWEGYWYEAR